jgi:hypothetical protein
MAAIPAAAMAPKPESRLKAALAVTWSGPLMVALAPPALAVVLVDAVRAAGEELAGAGGELGTTAPGEEPAGAEAAGEEPGTTAAGVEADGPGA